MDKNDPQIRVSKPHISPSWPAGPHQDIDFVQGKKPGQVPLPFERIHVPAHQKPLIEPPFR